VFSENFKECLIKTDCMFLMNWHAVRRGRLFILDSAASVYLRQENRLKVGVGDFRRMYPARWWRGLFWSKATESCLFPRVLSGSGRSGYELPMRINPDANRPGVQWAQLNMRLEPPILYAHEVF